MTLPANDPYREPDPNITGTGVSWGEWGITYQLYAEVASGNATKVTNCYIVGPSPSTSEKYPDLVFGGVTFTAGDTMRVYRLKMHFDSLSAGNYTIHVENPIWYKRQTPPHIILGIAHWWCEIAEADIDVTSFDTVHSWANGNSIYRTVAFYEKSALDIIKELCEMSWNIFIYVSGDHKLTCGYLEDEADDPADWTIDSDHYVRILEFGKIMDRKVPGKIGTFFDGRQVPLGKPRFPLWVYDNPGAEYSDKEQILTDIYNAYYVDDVPDEDLGGYTDWTQFIILKIEVTQIGHLMDLNESVAFDESLLAMGIDSSYKDHFRIHEIELLPDNIHAIITMLKKYYWNSPP